MEAMEKTGTTHLRLERDGVLLELGRPDPHGNQGGMLPSIQPVALPHEMPSSLGVMSQGVPPPELAPPPTGEESSAADEHVTSPIVGVFYPTPSPEDPPFIQVGDRVTPDTVVCIVEAMKVMNDVKAGVSGVIAEVLVERGQAVEFGTKLFRVTAG